MPLAAALIVATVGGTALAAITPEAIEIPLGESTLRAMLYRPSGPGPFRSVVALHDCNGLAGRTQPIARRYRDWGERLTAAGFVVLFPDSFGSRGVTSQCNVSLRERKVGTARERVADANAARQWLQTQRFVEKNRVSLLGWANGGTAALWAIRPRIAKQSPDFRSAVALFPGCRRLRDTAWSARVPTLILIGSADDWTPATACEQMVAGARGRTARATIIVYPGAHHDFDHPNLPLRQRSGLASSADGSGRVHVGTDPAARADAIRRVPEWLKR
jgi:dienelactone hydrolase